MTQYNAVSTKATGDTVAAADWNTYLRDNMDALAIQKIGYAYKSVNQSIPSGTPTQVVWGSSYTLVDFGLTGNALVPTFGGYYFLDVHVTWASNATGYRKLEATVQSRTLSLGKDIRMAVDGDESTNHLSAIANLLPGDTIDVTVTQNSGSSINLLSNVINCRFSLVLFSW